MLTFDYHYGSEAEQYTFYRVPKLLIKDAAFKTMSAEAKLLYGLMLDRLSLSLKNDWRDEHNRVFIFYTLEDIQDDMNCSHGKGVKLLSELDAIGLIHRVKQGQGKPTKIYVKKFAAAENNETQAGSQDFQKEEVQTSDFKKSGSQDIKIAEVQTSENEKSRVPKTGSADFRESERNYNDFNKTDLNDTEFGQSSPSAAQREDGQDADGTDDTARRIDAYTELIKENICYNDLAITRRFDVKMIDDFISIMVDVVLSVGRYVRINGEDKPRELVKSTFLKIGYGDMEHAIDQFKGVTERISKKKQYIISLLYNCKLEMDSHYTNLVKSDMYG